MTEPEVEAPAPPEEGVTEESAEKPSENDQDGEDGQEDVGQPEE
jgi:hypothetical protein